MGQNLNDSHYGHFCGINEDLHSLLFQGLPSHAAEMIFRRHLLYGPDKTGAMEVAGGLTGYDHDFRHGEYQKTGVRRQKSEF